MADEQYKTVNVLGVGNIRFPRSMSEAEIHAVLSRKFGVSKVKTTQPFESSRQGTAQTVGPQGEIGVPIPGESLIGESKKAPAWILSALPTIGALAASLAVGPEAGVLEGVLGAGSGGILGKSLENALRRKKQTGVEELKQLLEAGALQGTGEAAGRGILGPAISAVLGPAKIAPGEVAGEMVPGRAVADLSLSQGLRLTPGEIRGATGFGRLERSIQNLGEMGIIGNVTAAQAKRQGEDAAVRLADEVSDRIASKTTPVVAGRQVGTALEQANLAFKARANEFWEKKLPELSQGLSADFSPVIKEAQRITDEAETPISRQTIRIARGTRGSMELRTANIPESVKKALEAAGRPLEGNGEQLPVSSNVQRILTAMSNLKEKGTVEEALATKKWLDQYMPGPNQLFADTDAQRIAKRMESKLYEVLDESAKQSKPFEQQWLQARNFYRTGREIYDSRIVSNLISKDPEAVADSVKPGDVTSVNMIKKALLGHGSLPESKTLTRAGERTLTGTEAWDVFRRQYIQSNILKDPEGMGINSLFNLKDRLNAAGADQLKAIFATDGKGRIALHDLRTLAETMSRVNPVTKHSIARIVEAGLFGATMFMGPEKAILETLGFESGPAVISRILYSPAATRYFIKGIETANIAGRATGSGPRILALAATNISRAVDIAFKAKQARNIKVQ